MDKELLQRLIALEPELRQLAGVSDLTPHTSITIAFDATGTTYSHSTNDEYGNSSNYNQRILSTPKKT